MRHRAPLEAAPSVVLKGTPARTDGPGLMWQWGVGMFHPFKVGCETDKLFEPNTVLS